MSPDLEFTFREDAPVSVEQAIALFVASTLGERRPIERPDIIAGMLGQASITMTAWKGERLVGICRTLTDFTYVAYLADLAVDKAFQRLGIGKRLIEETRKKIGSDCMLVLLAAPDAHAYYPKLGFEHNPRAWILKKAGVRNADVPDCSPEDSGPPGILHTRTP